jgi:hypothetical protein
MATSIGFTSVQVHCPLCGSPVLSLGRNGRLVMRDARAVQLGAEPGRGYTLCDDCGALADSAVELTLN